MLAGHQQRYATSMHNTATSQRAGTRLTIRRASPCTSPTLSSARKSASKHPVFASREHVGRQKRSPATTITGVPVPFYTTEIRRYGPSDTVKLSAAAFDAVHESIITSSSRKQLTAVVVGSGMAGLAAAAALSEHFARIVVLEADSPKESWKQDILKAEEDHTPIRPGVGQYHFLHALMARGAIELDKLVPGFTDALLERGAVKTDWLKHSQMASPAGPCIPVYNSQQPIHFYQATRHLVEQTLRNLVLQNPNISVSYNTRVTGLLYGGEADKAGNAGSLAASSSSSSSTQEQMILGVKVANGDSQHNILADLVVVACGRRGEVSRWLRDGGWPEPTVSQANANCRYVNWLLKLSPEVEGSLPYNGFYYQAQPPNIATNAFMQRVEGDIWTAAVGGFNNQGPRAKMSDVMAFIEQDPYLSALYPVVKEATPLSPVKIFSKLNNTWNHYEKVLPPDGLLVIGDAYCNFNPVYAQGISIAAQEAQIIRSLLIQRFSKTTSTTGIKSGSSSSSSNASQIGAAAAAADTARAAALKGLNAEFYSAAAKLVGTAWMMAAFRDLQFPFATAENQELTGLNRLLLAYVDVMYKLAVTDTEVSETFGRVVHMLDPPDVLFKPSIIAKALAHVLTGWPWGSAPTGWPWGSAPTEWPWGSEEKPKTPQPPKTQAASDGTMLGA